MSRAPENAAQDGEGRMRPLGYLYKRVSAAPAWLRAPQVADVYSLSGHVSQDFADYVPYWRHNGFWLFDSPSVLEALAGEHSIPLDGLRLFYYEAYELQWDDATGAWVPYGPEASLQTDVRPPVACTREGFDVVTFSAGTAPECSPLSCNGLAAELPTNSHCLLPTFGTAVRALEEGRFGNTEPGPYRIVAVSTVRDG